MVEILNIGNCLQIYMLTAFINICSVRLVLYLVFVTGKIYSIHVFSIDTFTHSDIGQEGKTVYHINEIKVSLHSKSPVRIIRPLHNMYYIMHK